MFGKMFKQDEGMHSRKFLKYDLKKVLKTITHNFYRIILFHFLRNYHKILLNNVLVTSYFLKKLCYEKNHS